MATRSRARHFHATAKALTAAAATRAQDATSTSFGATVHDLDISALIAGAPVVGDELPRAEEQPLDARSADTVVLEHATSLVRAEDLVTMHEELRWAESKLMQASERLAEAQEQRRKDLVALAIMRRELLGSFSAERTWLHAGMRWMRDVLPSLEQREAELDELVDAGARTTQIIHELAAVRAERKLFELALEQSAAQLARIDDNEATSEFQVASEAYDREPDGASMREVARLRAQSTKARREANRLRHEVVAVRDQLGFVTGVGEITAANAFLVAEYEGDERASERMATVRAAQVGHELSRLPEPEAAWKNGLRHPVQFMRARRTVR